MRCLTFNVKHSEFEMEESGVVLLGDGSRHKVFYKARFSATEGSISGTRVVV